MKRIASLLGLLAALCALPVSAASTINSVQACGAAGSLVVPIAPGFTTATVEVTGAWVATGLLFQGANTTTYANVQATPLPSGAPISQTAANGQWLIQVSGIGNLCVTGVGTWTSGTANVNITLSLAPFEPLFLDIPVGVSTSLYGTTTAPGAGGVIATMTPGAGTYDITVSCGYGTGAVAAETDNMQLQVGGSVIQRLIVPATANGLPVSYTFRRVAVPAATTVTVNATAAGTAAVPYKATLSLLPVN